MLFKLLSSRITQSAFLTLVIAAPLGAQPSTPASVVLPNAHTNDLFGMASAISGDTLIAGAPRVDLDGQADRGAAAVFRWNGASWVLESFLTAPGGAGDWFGNSVAISGDTAVVGSPAYSTPGLVGRGAAFVFRRGPAGWTLNSTLLANDAAPSDTFGASVAISGGRIAVGATGVTIEGRSFQGAAYVFDQQGASWAQTAKLTASDGESNSHYGFSIAIDRDVVVVGADWHRFGGGFMRGTAYVYRRVNGSWTQEAQLSAPEGDGVDPRFGASVAVSGDTVLAGAYNGISQAGCAYVFSRSGQVWTQQARLRNPQGSFPSFFGISVGLDRDTAVVGATSSGYPVASGSAFVFARTGGSWSPQAMLNAPDGQSGDSLGRSVAVWGDHVVAGSISTDRPGGANQGAAYIFSRARDYWIGPDLRAFATDRATGDDLGRTIAVRGDLAFVGMPGDDVGPNVDQGSVRVFKLTGGGWLPFQTITAPGGAAGDRFGSSVAVSGSYAVIGADHADFGLHADQGAAYIFVEQGLWSHQVTLYPFNGAAGTHFGSSVAILGNTAVVGAESDVVGADNARGAVYVFERSGNVWPQQGRLTAPDGAAGDHLGTSVALFDIDTLLVGAPSDTVGTSAEAGSVRVFRRNGPAWAYDTAIEMADGAPGDRFGSSLASDGTTAIAGAPFADSIEHTDQGAVAILSRDAQGAWHTARIAPPSPFDSGHFGAAVAIAGRTAVVGAPGPAGGSVDVFARLPDAWGPARHIAPDDLEPGDRLGEALAITGDLILAGMPGATAGGTLSCGSFLSANGAIDDQVIVQDASNGTRFESISQAAQAGVSNVIATPAAFRLAGSVVADTVSLTSTAGIAIPTGGTLDLGQGSNITAAPHCRVDVFGRLLLAGGDHTVETDLFTLGVGAGLSLSGGGTLDLRGSLECAIHDSGVFDLSAATLRLGGDRDSTLEVMSSDLGPDPAGFLRGAPGRFPLGALVVGTSPRVVRLIDREDNDDSGQTMPEAIYAGNVVIQPGGRLVTGGLRIYCRSFVNLGTIDEPANVIVCPEPCLADFNLDSFIDFFDYSDYVTCFETGSCPPGRDADFNGDGFADFFDYGDFVAAFEAGC